ncbi:4-hydroxyphenylacetate 3-hydroxylase C-terminal domain-containing protein [Cohnella thailandensis]|uniref:HpaB/PvcC/4-BUDH C-terminal domain-containing protein n=1 Tax=Cohnella thailandensis TaxID=557557 RepID=A0A841T2G9_9BACL|nr:4-hydroxyphenylacetate 3-hydroxylase C-terminal domain-containing protein [Cohnella thailandensis]MBB6636077.1 hypothetical protein [Cohnella thailandensis]MBP1973954.1 4-hydroxyphenylacetate 3-monooxygenase [Cohnella thailandensis]
MPIIQDPKAPRPDPKAGEGERRGELGRDHGLNVNRPLREQAYLLPRTAEELRRKRSGLHELEDGASVFAAGWADYAHALFAGWQAHERHLHASGIPIAANGDRSLQRLYRLSEQRRALITTSFHPLAGHGNGQPVLRFAPEGGVRLSGTQTFGEEAAFADELLVFVRGNDPKEPAAAVLVSTATEGLRLLPAGSGEARAEGAQIDPNASNVQIDPNDPNAPNDPQAPNDHNSSNVQVPQGSFSLVQAQYDDVKVPRERLLFEGDTEALNRLLNHPLVKSLADYQWASRQLAALELIGGTAFALAEQTGLGRELHIQGELGELIQRIETLRALLHAAELGAEAGPEGVLLPAPVPLQAALKAGGDYYGKSVLTLQRIGAGAFLADPSVPAAAAGKPTLAQLAWQLAGSGAAARRALHEQHALGDSLALSQELYRNYPVRLLRSRYAEFWRSLSPLARDGTHESEVRR